MVDFKFIQYKYVFHFQRKKKSLKFVYAICCGAICSIKGFMKKKKNEKVNPKQTYI